MQKKGVNSGWIFLIMRTCVLIQALLCYDINSPFQKGGEGYDGMGVFGRCDH